MSSSQPQLSQSSPIGVHIATAACEILFIVSELVLGVQFIQYVKSKTLPFNHDSASIEILFDLFAYIALLACIVFSVAFNIGLRTHTLLREMGLHRIASVDYTMVAAMVILHCLGIVVNVVLFYAYDDWRFTWSNIMDPFTGSLDVHRLFDIVICSPVREEIVYRGLLFLLLYRHVDPSQFTESKSKQKQNEASLTAIKRCMLISSIVFGCIHGFNLMGTTYSTQYAMVQISMGCIVSLFYTLRMVISKTLWEPILLHMINNAFSLFVEFNSGDVTHALILIPIMISAMIYTVFIWYNWNGLQRVWKHTRSSKKKKRN